MEKTRKVSSLTLILKSEDPKELVELNQACDELIENFIFFGDAKAEMIKQKGQYNINPLENEHIKGAELTNNTRGEIMSFTNSNFELQTPKNLYFFQTKHNPLYAPFNSA